MKPQYLKHWTFTPDRTLILEYLPTDDPERPYSVYVECKDPKHQWMKPYWINLGWFRTWKDAMYSFQVRKQVQESCMKP